MNEKKAAAYDGIAQEISRLKREIGILHELIVHHRSQAEAAEEEIGIVKKRIEMFRDISDNHLANKSGDGNRIEVTDHAVIRYIERVMGIDVGRIRDKISGGEVARCAKTIGDGRYPVEKGVKAVVKGGKVVTIIKYGGGSE